MLLGAIEGGGTKFVVCIGDENGNIIKKHAFPTSTPQETMNEIFNFFDDSGIEALGIGMFGPLDLNKSSPTYGYVTTTPKPNWSNFNVLGLLKERYNIPINIDTDVNGACLGELFFGSAQGLNSCLYLTIGTGIGGGAVVEGKLVHGLLHPEMGHMKLIRHPDDDFEGICPFHQNCFEGLASGPAIEKRYQQKAYLLDENHPAWDIEAYYIAQALVTYILVLSPEKIVLGGGVMKQKQLFPKIHQQVITLLNGYIQKDELTLQYIEQYIVEPMLGDCAGICGALALAYEAFKNNVK